MRSKLFLLVVLVGMVCFNSCNQEEDMRLHQEEIESEIFQQETDLDVYAHLEESVQAIIRSLDLSMRGLPANVNEITISPTGVLNPNGDIRMAIATGSFTSAILVKAQDLSNSQDLATGTIAGNGMMGYTTLSIPAYEAPLTYPSRVVGFFYWGSTNQWELFHFETQGPNGTDPIDPIDPVDPGDHIILKTGRIVAYNNAGLYGNTGSSTMTWTQAMGILDTWKNAYFYTSGYSDRTTDNFRYTHQASSGCGAYSETNFPAGKWFAPTLDEMLEIYERKSEITNLMLNPSPAYYWASTEIITSANPGRQTNYVELNYGWRYPNTGADKSGPNSFYVRCVAFLE